MASSSTESSRDGAARPIRRRGSTLGWPTNGRRRPGEIHHELLLLDDDGSRINRIGRLNGGAAPGVRCVRKLAVATVTIGTYATDAMKEEDWRMLESINHSV